MVHHVLLTHVDLDSDVDSDEGSDGNNVEDLSTSIEQSIASVLLKLENILHVPATAIDKLLQELHYLLNSTSVPVTHNSISNILRDHSLQIDESIIKELAEVVCKSNPLGKAISKEGPLATAFKRKKYYKQHFNVVEPIEFILDRPKNKTHQYIPILPSLQKLFNCKDILESATDYHKTQNTGLGNEQQYRSIRDSLYFRENSFFSGEDFKIAISLYIDDFEVCNPIGTSRKTHKLCGVYWILNNLPPGSHSALSSIYLAVLCKTDDAKAYGYKKVLEPLLQDLITLEEHGVFIAGLGCFTKGTVQSIIADNLGAHGIAGFVESFSGEYYCRFCTGSKLDIKAKSVQSGSFDPRTEDIHEAQIKSAKENAAFCFGVKRGCVFTEKLSYFHVTRGYPPDIVHDLFEGIVPVEIALCVSIFISKKYLSLLIL